MDWKELMYGAFAEQGGVDPRDFVQQQAAERQAQAPLDGDGQADDEGLDVEIHYYAVHVDEETTRIAQSVGELRQALSAAADEREGIVLMQMEALDEEATIERLEGEVSRQAKGQAQVHAQAAV